MKYNILQFSFGDGYAGSAKVAVLNSKALIDEGHTVKLFVSKDSVTKKRALEKGIPVVELDSRKKISLLIKDVIDNLIGQKVDFALANHSLDRKVVIKLKRKFKNDIISVAYRHNISLSTPIIGPIIYNKYFDFMIACSNGVAASLIKEGIRKDKVSVIHNIAELPEDIEKISGLELRNNLGINDKFVLGISSWFHKERKGFDILFEAFSKLNQKFILLIIGIPKENQKEVYEYASTFGISGDRILMPGFVTNVYEYYKAMDIFLLPSRSEGFSLALLEAAASGLPIIASNIPGNNEFIEHGKNGLLFNILKPDELSHEILQLANDRKLADKLRIAARDSFIKNYSLNRYIEKLNKFFDEAYLSKKK